MTERQLRRIINEEINNILKESVVDSIEAAVESARDWASNSVNRRIGFCSIEGDYDWGDVVESEYGDDANDIYAVMLFYYNQHTGKMYMASGDRPDYYSCSGHFVTCKTEAEAIILAKKYAMTPTTNNKPIPLDLKNPNDYMIVLAVTCKLDRFKGGDPTVSASYDFDGKMKYIKPNFNNIKSKYIRL